MASVSATDIRFTLAEAAPMLNPRVSEQQLAAMVRTLKLRPAGVRRTGRPGRPEQTWDWATITKLHECLLPFLGSHDHA